MGELLFQKRRFVFYFIVIGGLLLYSLLGIKGNSLAENKLPCPKPYIKILVPKAARPGEKIKIRGNRFGVKNGSVTFSPGIKAPILKWMNNRIRVIIPKHAKTGPVFVSNHCGEISNKKYFTIKNGEGRSD